MFGRCQLLLAVIGVEAEACVWVNVCITLCSETSVSSSSSSSHNSAPNPAPLDAEALWGHPNATGQDPHQPTAAKSEPSTGDKDDGATGGGEVNLTSS